LQFAGLYQLKLHLHVSHEATSRDKWTGAAEFADLGHACEPCRRFFANDRRLRQHRKIRHEGKNISSVKIEDEDSVTENHSSQIAPQSADLIFSHVKEEIFD